MTCGRGISLAAVTVAWVLVHGPRCHAQVYAGYPPYGYRINNGAIGPGYQAAYRLQPYRYGVMPQQQTVTDYQSLINAITSIPGWYGPSGSVHPPRPIHPQPTVPRNELLADDGRILWPEPMPTDPKAALARQAAEEAVKTAVDESRKYGHATIRHVIDARNKLTALAGRVLPALKTANAAEADRLERFIVELQKTLATLAVNY